MSKMKECYEEVREMAEAIGEMILYHSFAADEDERDTAINIFTRWLSGEVRDNDRDEPELPHDWIGEALARRVECQQLISKLPRRDDAGPLNGYLVTYPVAAQWSFRIFESLNDIREYAGSHPHTQLTLELLNGGASIYELGKEYEAVAGQITFQHVQEAG